MIIASAKAPPPPPPKCACNVLWDAPFKLTTPEIQRTIGDVRVQATTPEKQSVSDIKFVLEYTIS